MRGPTGPAWTPRPCGASCRPEPRRRTSRIVPVRRPGQSTRPGRPDDSSTEVVSSAETTRPRRARRGSTKLASPVRRPPEERRLRAQAARVLELAHGVGDGQRVGRILEVDLAARFEVGGGLAVGDDQQHRLGDRVLAEVPVGQASRGRGSCPCPAGVEGGERPRCPWSARSAEGVSCSASPRNRDRSACAGRAPPLHRRPAPVHRRRTRSRPAAPRSFRASLSLRHPRRRRCST